VAFVACCAATTPYPVPAASQTTTVSIKRGGFLGAGCVRACVCGGEGV
jgi:hypothetical protein